ncbi:MAG TPA: SUMF1/EgtB/PvdO family nonheme iron enzyme [Polyangiaceae bacterium]|nr:SUMF1/EgtB/PvdO family nonheme iron enzyme [Polyangiaceae bacterium]
MVFDETRSASPTINSGGRGGGPEPGAMFASGQLVGRYRVRRLLGEGGMGQVFLARDESLGRSVALKVIRPGRVSAHDTQRFTLEAQTTASLSHPHIVVLYEFGECRGLPYFALEYLDGETLRERAERERLSVDEALRTAQAIAGALAHAHAAGVYHCDLKPGNVMLPKDGRLRVVDFGLAATAAARAASPGVAGTPDWMAPEQWRGETPTDRVDSWALGVMLFELLAGEHPFGGVESNEERRAAVLDGSRPPRALGRDDLPRPVVDLIEGSLARNPGARPSAAEWHRGLEEVLAGGAAPPLDDGPYRGLSAFGEEHAKFFFGREPEIESYLEQLRACPILPVVGPSGAGKSSFLHGGVIPRLRARARWRVIAVRPGPNPFVALAHGLLGAASDDPGRWQPGREAEALAGELRATPTLLSLRLATIASAGEHVLLAIDQLEEIFTQGAPEADAQRFLELLAGAADDPAEPVRVAVTLRDDFLGRVPTFRSVFVLKRLGPAELRRTIVGPLERVGYRFEVPSLVDDMLSEVGDELGDLPLLQFACRSLWDARDAERRELPAAGYRELGGVAGALARHAERFQATLTAHEQGVARQLLVRLVAGATARRVVGRGALLSGLPPEAASVLDRLLSARLVIQRRPHGESGFVVELAHESLLKSWAQLARWVDESRDERRLLQELEEAAALWGRRGRRPEETWGAEELASARHRAEQLGVALPELVEDFLREGERRQAAMRRRARLLLGAGAIAAALVTAGSLGLAALYRHQKLQAEELQLAAGNVGEIDLVLRPFDLVEGRPVPASPRELPSLAWRLHGPKPGDAHHPGPPLPAMMVRREARSLDDRERVEHVRAPGGVAFLRIEGRGRAGEACAPSWLRLQALPGYASRGKASPRVEIDVPTCRASAAGMVEIPAGAFVYGGPGEPPTKHPDYVEPERTVHLDTFSIDRTEVSNAAFRPFAALAELTGYPAPVYPTESAPVLAHTGEPEMPVTSIDAFAAEAYCRYLGKRLPGDDEWAKAARGGLEVNGRPNPHPRRLFPWGVTPDERCANIEGAHDGSRWTARVDSFACGASPYGVLHLSGNVAEWISREGQNDKANVLRVVRGGGVDSPHLEQATTILRNAREARYFDFAIGVRCAAGGPSDEE